MQGKTSDYSFALKPNLDITPAEDTELTVSVPGVDFGNKAITGIPDGITAVGGNGTITLTFDGNTSITKQTGLSFTAAAVTNPSAPSVTASAGVISCDGLSVGPRSFYAFLRERPDVKVTISNWEAISAMHLRLTLTKNDSTLQSYPTAADTVWQLPAEFVGQSVSAKLEAQDALGAWHELATGSFTGNDTEDNAVSLTASAAALTGYTLNTTPSSAKVYLTKGDSRQTLTPYNGKYWLTNTTDLAVDYCHFASDSDYENYSTDAPTPTVSGSTISVSYTAFSKNASISGTVKDSEDNALAGASVTVSQTLSGRTRTISTVTDSTGTYSVTGLVSGFGARVCASLSGYAPESLTVTPSKADVNITLDAAVTLRVLLTNGGVQNAHFTVKVGDTPYSFVSDKSAGSDYTLRLTNSSAPTDGTYTVTLNADELESEATGSVAVAKGVGALDLAPAHKGQLDWSGCDAYGCCVFVYSGDTLVYNSFSGISESAVMLPGGSYTVYISKEYADSKNDFDTLVSNGKAKSKAVTITSNAKTALGTDMNPGTATGAVGTAEAPDKAGSGECYRVSGVITSPENLTSLSARVTLGGGISAISINGALATMQTSGATYCTATKEGNPQIDWSLPLSYTIYCVQQATQAHPRQTVTVEVYGSLHVGSAVTEWTPTLTLGCANAVGGQDTGDGKLRPAAVPFGGTAAANAEVTLYDNGVLCAVAQADEYGRYEGLAQLVTDEVAHTLRAEAGGLTAEDTLLYDPCGAVLTGLRLDGVELPLNGRNTAYSVTPNSDFTLTATFSNGTKLADITATVGGAEKSGKVFFQVSTVGGTYVFKATGSGNTYTASNCRFGKDYPTGIKVLYKSQTVADATITLGEESLTVDGAFKGTGGFDWADYFTQIQADAASVNQFSLQNESSGNDTVRLLANSPSSSELFSDIASALGNGCTAISPANAAANGSSDFEYRTYFDEPTWSSGSRNLKVKELIAKGYRSYSYTDETTQKQYLMLSGTFYYGSNAYPVPSLYIQVADGAFRKNVEDPRVWKDGNMVGSTLQVIYICDVSAGKWWRSQAALVPPNAKSPIHTSKNQIPCTTDAPTTYSASLLSNSTRSVDSVRLMDAGGLYGIKFSVDPTKVSTKTYIDGASRVTMMGVGKVIKSETWLCKASSNLEYWNIWTKKTSKIREASKLKVGIKAEDIGTTAAGFIGSQVNNSVSKTTSLPETFDGLRQTLTGNLRYWGRQSENASNMSSYMKERTSNMMNDLTKLEDELLRAASQDQFTQDSTNKMMWLSMAAGFAPGVGTASSGTLDALAFLMNAANDTRSAEAMELVRDFIGKYGNYLTIDQEYKQKLHELLGDDAENADEDDPLKNKDAKLTPVHDPSGIVYEAVLSNPVAGAEVKLYYANDGNGGYVQKNGSSVVYAAATPVLHNDVHYLGQQNPLTTGADGYYRWDVPTGLWYVTAEKAGFEAGSSEGDIAATVTANSKSWLPVLPPQLAVNIPLVSYAAPTVTAVQYKTDGVYVTFSKYMDEEALTAASFVLNGATPAAVELVDRGSTPANRNGGAITNYTRTVKLKATLSEGAAVSLGISTAVKSYAGVNMASEYTASGSVSAMEQLALPTFSPVGGTVAQNTPVTISAANGATIYYTTNGDTPTSSSSRYTAPIVISRSTTLKAVAVKAGCTDSGIASAAYTVSSYAPPVNPNTPNAPTYPGEDGEADLPTVICGIGGNTALSSDGRTLTITPDKGYRIKKVLLNGASQGAVNTLTELKPEDRVEVFFEKLADAKGFSDVKTSDWFYGDVEFICSEGLMKGVSKTSFDPHGATTRGMIVTMLHRLEEEPQVSGSSFADVVAGRYYSAAVSWAAKNKIVSGYGGGLFGPDDPISREQMATILYNYAVFKGYEVSKLADLGSFSDKDSISGYARTALSWANAAGLLKGDSGRLLPDGNAERCQVAAILHRFCDAFVN